MRVQLIAKPDTGHTGTYRYTQNVYRGLKEAGVDVALTSPEPIPAWLQRGFARFGLDARAFFASYPLRVRLQPADIYHITSQTLATLLLFQRFSRPVVVTVLDILPYLLRHDPQLNTLRHPADGLFYRLALLGLKRADAWIAISEYTKRTLIETLHLPAEKIHVIYPAIDTQIFRPQPVPDEFCARHGLSRDQFHLLYVGSDDPRKNLPILIRALAYVKQSVSNVKLIKVGAAHFHTARQSMVELIESLGLTGDVLFFENVPDDELALFYNAVDAFVFPSEYEGFGLPVAEAVACGCPVIASNRTSLPEVAGKAGVLVDTKAVQSWSDAICQVLEGQALRDRLVQAGLDRTPHFSSKAATVNTVNVYRQCCATDRTFL